MVTGLSRFWLLNTNGGASGGRSGHAGVAGTAECVKGTNVEASSRSITFGFALLRSSLRQLAAAKRFLALEWVDVFRHVPVEPSLAHLPGQ